MTLDLKKARQLCTDREFALVAAARRPAMSTLSAKRLQAHALRSRTLRDKFRVLAREQKAKASPARPRSLEKAALFDEVLARFELRLAKLEGVRSAGAPRSKSARGTTAKRVKADTLGRSRRLTARR